MRISILIKCSGCWNIMRLQKLDCCWTNWLLVWSPKLTRWIIVFLINQMNCINLFFYRLHCNTGNLHTTRNLNEDTPPIKCAFDKANIFKFIYRLYWFFLYIEKTSTLFIFRSGCLYASLSTLCWFRVLTLLLLLLLIVYIMRFCDRQTANFEKKFLESNDHYTWRSNTDCTHYARDLKKQNLSIICHQWLHMSSIYPQKQKKANCNYILPNHAMIFICFWAN